MRIKSIHIRNFGTVKRLDLDLDHVGFTRVLAQNLDGGSDSNGVGKSTIFRALCWCFFGLIPGLPKRIGDSVVNPTVGKDCSVMTILEEERPKREIKIERTRLVGEKKKDSYLLIEGLEEAYKFDMRGKDMDESTDKIVEILGCDYEVFIQAYYFPQEGVIPFGFLTDKMLKEFFLNKFLGIGWIESARAIVVADKKKTDKEITSINQSLEHQTSLLAQYDDDIKENRERISEWEKEHTLKVLKLKKDLSITKKLHKELTTEFKKHKDDIAKYKGMKEDLIEKVSSLSMNTDETNLTINGKIHSIKRISDRVGEADRRRERLEGELKSGGAKFICPTCKQPLKIKDADIIKAGLQKELDEAVEIIKTGNSRIEELNGEIQKLEKQLEKDKAKHKAKLEALEKQLREVRDKYDKLMSTAPRESEIRRLESQIKVAEAAVKDEEFSANPWEEVERDIKQKKKSIEEMTDEDNKKLEQLEQQLIIQKFWVTGFSPAGIQNHLLESITPLINDRIAGYLNILSDGHLVAEFETIEKLKSGEFREKFRLKASNRLGASEYLHLSGGEKARVNIAVSLALGDLKRIQSSKSLNLLILDEIFTGLDESGKSDVLEMISLAYPDMCVYVVSHEEISHHMFTRELLLHKKNGVTILAV